MPTKAQKEALAEYVDSLKTAMWLGPWRIDLVWDGDIEPDAYASVRPTYGQRHAQIRVCVDFFDLPAWSQRRSLAHELLHCYAADVQELGASLHTNIGDQAYEAWKPGWRLAVEHMVDGLTTMIAHEDSKFLPLPSLPKDAD